MNNQNKQDFGDDPLKVRETDHYVEEYVDDFVEKWDSLIDWEGRASGERGFFAKVLRDYGKHKVLDVAAGTGFHSVQLMKEGFDVTSVDGSAAMLAKAFENAKEQGYILQTICSDWRWLTKDVHDKYDAVVCLGNSFTHIHDEKDRRKALAEMYAVLRNDGILILDQRNYEAILDHGIQPGHSHYYCGNNVKAEPEYIDDSLARFRYEFSDGEVYHLNMFPLRKAYTRQLMEEVGFQRITTYGDFELEYDDQKADFLIHIAEKEYKTGEEPHDE